jgi:hypothetical protein
MGASEKRGLAIQNFMITNNSSCLCLFQNTWELYIYIYIYICYEQEYPSDLLKTEQSSAVRKSKFIVTLEILSEIFIGLTATIVRTLCASVRGCHVLESIYSMPSIIYVNEEVKMPELFNTKILCGNLKMDAYRLVRQDVKYVLLFSLMSSWLLTQRSRVRFPALPNCLRSSGSGTESTQPLWG